MAEMSRTEIYQQILENEADLIERMGNLSTGVSPMEQAREQLETSLNIIGRPVIPSPLNLLSSPIGRPRRQLGMSQRARRLNQAPPPSSLSNLPPPGRLVRQEIVVSTGCSHTLTRGPRRGEPCNKRFYHSSEYCRNHYRRYVSPEVRPETRPAVYDDIKEDHTHLLYKSCAICNHKTEGPKVILECECEYHLNCYMMIQHEKNCFKCGDKIHKQDSDYPDCSICLDKIKINKVKTSCGHSFHKHCIDAWCRIGRGVNTDKCPNCRTDL